MIGGGYATGDGHRALSDRRAGAHPGRRDDDGERAARFAGTTAPRRSPRFWRIIVMPLAVSVTDGIAFGFIAYALLKLGHRPRPRTRLAGATSSPCSSCCGTRWWGRVCFPQIGPQWGQVSGLWRGDGAAGASQTRPSERQQTRDLSQSNCGKQTRPPRHARVLAAELDGAAPPLVIDVAAGATVRAAGTFAGAVHLDVWGMSLIDTSEAPLRGVHVDDRPPVLAARRHARSSRRRLRAGLRHARGARVLVPRVSRPPERPRARRRLRRPGRAPACR